MRTFINIVLWGNIACLVLVEVGLIGHTFVEYHAPYQFWTKYITFGIGSVLTLSALLVLMYLVQDFKKRIWPR